MVEQPTAARCPLPRPGCGAGHRGDAVKVDRVYETAHKPEPPDEFRVAQTNEASG